MMEEYSGRLKPEALAVDDLTIGNLRSVTAHRSHTVTVLAGGGGGGRQVRHCSHTPWSQLILWGPP